MPPSRRATNARMPCARVTISVSSRAALRPWPRVGVEHVLVHLDAPARPARDVELAGRDLRERGHELVAPRDVVDVELEDARVRYGSAPLGRDERREVTVVVVRRAVDLERLREVGDLLRLVEAVPDDVDRRDVDPARLEVRPEVAAPVQVLARA